MTSFTLKGKHISSAVSKIIRFRHIDKHKNVLLLLFIDYQTFVHFYWIKFLLHICLQYTTYFLQPLKIKITSKSWFCRKCLKCLMHADREVFRLSAILIQVIGPYLASTSYCGLPDSPIIKINHDLNHCEGEGSPLSSINRPRALLHRSIELNVWLCRPTEIPNRQKTH